MSSATDNSGNEVTVENADVSLQRDVFLRSLLRELAGSLEEIVGIDEAAGFISLVGQKIGDDIDQSYRQALSVSNLSRLQVADVLVNLKKRIEGDFYVISQEDEKIVFGFVDKVADAYGGVDVLINVAGIITVGPLDVMTMEDFEDSMQTNCWGALRTSCAVLPHMRTQEWGRIVNVASLGGKHAVPHMLPYAASKFASRAA